MTNFGKELIQSAREALGMADPIITEHIGTVSFQGTAAEVAEDIARWFPRIAKEKS